jgi:hypothetical protein
MEGVYPISAFDITRRSHEYTIKTQLFQGNQPAGPAPDRQRVGYLCSPGRLAEAAGSPRGDELRRQALRAHTRPDQATGEQIARLTGVPGALVTTGAARTIFVGTCACIAGSDPEGIKRLPFTEGVKNQIVLQKLHNTGWTRQCEAAGGRIVEVEEKDQMERAIGNQTAMIYFLIADKHFGQ